MLIKQQGPNPLHSKSVLYINMRWQSLSFLSLVASQTGAFVVRQESRSSHSSSTTNNIIARQAAAEDPSTKDQAATGAVNGDVSGSIMLQADAKSQLFASFSALSLSDQYDAVLTGLCAKILDSAESKPENAIVALEDPLSLLEEMNGKRIPASARSLMALVDVGVVVVTMLLLLLI